MWFRRTFGNRCYKRSLVVSGLWQIVLALVTLTVALMQPGNMPRLLFVLTTAQFILMAGVGHATLNEGLTAKIHQTNHAVHLICAAAWFGGLLPVALVYAVGERALATSGHSCTDAILLVWAFCGDWCAGKRRA